MDDLEREKLEYQKDKAERQLALLLLKMQVLQDSFQAMADENEREAKRSIREETAHHFRLVGSVWGRAANWMKEKLDGFTVESERREAVGTIDTAL